VVVCVGSLCCPIRFRLREIKVQRLCQKSTSDAGFAKRLIYRRLGVEGQLCLAVWVYTNEYTCHLCSRGDPAEVKSLRSLSLKAVRWYSAPGPT